MTYEDLFDRRWNLQNRSQVIRDIDRWACVFVSAQPPNQQEVAIAGQFIEQFPQVIGQYGIHFRSRPLMFSERAHPEAIYYRLEQLKQEHCEVVLFILHGVGEDIYKSIKTSANQKLGIVTQ